ncbi:single-stranded DNA-binding protein [Amycolatopsis acidicola]|uniref:Single-stranded DNA-binding protein n=1 Tax=Amycolatopsis acidicola TaxID=2596893 RepID=A0A5N0V8K1_9PSEU|nr:single-stranded DNA-binding protein [Amycolatopsis acidicola]KAA9160852.1 single-stranded DNA-binding protein [Amycolatopsis acidicola]
MAIGETPVTLVGTVVSEVESLRVGAQRHELAMFWLRSDERRYDKGKGEWVEGRHLSIRVKCWRRLAEAVSFAIRKGDPVILSGRLYSNDRGEREQSRVVPEVEALAVGLNLAVHPASARPSAQLDLELLARPESVREKQLVGVSEPLASG